ncbi:MAG: hypothetical protein ABIR17_13100 [Pseudolysinimonas sp.]|uniref:hypothetical protein n=1 Tax=Pseudolysinimonas sp. TaxID=2680009 RepID=UPI003264B117
MSLLVTALDVLTNVPTGIPDPEPVAPPGAEGPVAVLLSWAKWLGLIAAVVGIIIIAIKIAINVRRGEAAGELGGLLYIAIACILVGSAVSLVGFISGA